MKHAIPVTIGFVIGAALFDQDWGQAFSMSVGAWCMVIAKQLML